MNRSERIPRPRRYITITCLQNGAAAGVRLCTFNEEIRLDGSKFMFFCLQG